MTPLEEVPVVLEGLAFTIRLPSFDGPLELLLHLIRREELNIFDIPISRLTQAYLGYLEELRQLSIEPASEFLVMAATLMHIKSVTLLPRPPVGQDDAGELLDPRDELVRRLLEYQRFKEVAQALDLQARAGRDVFYRLPGLDRPPDPEDEQDLANQDIFRLAEAFRRLIRKGRFQAPHDIHVERISIAERIAQIAELLALEERTTFEALCVEARHREELITTFLALLEMARLKLIRVTQGDRLGPLYVEARVGAIGALGEDAAGMMDDPTGPSPAGVAAGARRDDDLDDADGDLDEDASRGWRE